MMYRIDSSSPGVAVDSVFQEVYDALERLQHDREQTGSITTSIVNCARELRNLERIHGLRWKFYGPTSSEDPFDVHDMLKKFVNSCNAFSYVSSSACAFDDEDLPDGCHALFPQKKTWKKKHFKALDGDFYEHQRILSLALANAV
jgi:hypothetical protein